MARNQTVYLVVRSDGSVRAAKRPRIGPDEIAIAIDLVFPDGWGRVISAYSVNMPAPPTVSGEPYPTENS